jgi:hypothetical protein
MIDFSLIDYMDDNINKRDFHMDTLNIVLQAHLFHKRDLRCSILVEHHHMNMFSYRIDQLKYIYEHIHYKRKDIVEE